ncbi:ABC transporter permease [Allorhizocola rhizosphaerae]|uniref:ABC transporter permease n=1 Tax=Allorhizocola rhizosphaerae TaxID=1872709 RepID=UPI000E3BD2CD|nr:ABC transporter permease [Allorhizocola rhizosphaerae]
MIGALRSEWTKLRTSPGTIWLLLAVVVATVAVSAAAVAGTTCRWGGCDVDPARLALTGVQLGQAVAAILAVLVIGGEYGTGMHRITLTAVPRRGVVLVAKAVVVSAVIVAASAAAVAGSLLATRPLLRRNGLPALSMDDGGAVRAAVGSVLYLTLVALLALGVATAVRHSAAAIGAVLGLLYLFPIMAQAVSDEKWQRYLTKLGPMTAGLTIQATKHLTELPIAPWKGLGVLAVWSVGCLLAGGALLVRRDA